MHPRGSPACRGCGALHLRRRAFPAARRGLPCGMAGESAGQSEGPALRSSLLPESQPAEALVEARDLTAGIEQLLVAAGPCWVHLRVDVEVQGVPFLAPGRTGLELGAVGHF